MSFFLELAAWVERQHQITLSKSWFTQHLLPQFHCTPCWMHANECSSLLRFWFLRIKVWFYEFFPWLSYLGGKKTSNYMISGCIYPMFIITVSLFTLLNASTNIQIDTNLGKSPDYTLCVFYCSRFFFQKFPIRWDFIIFLKHTLSFPILLIKLFFKTAVPLPHIVEIHALSMPTKWGI